MRIFLILFFFLFSNLALTQTLKKSEDEFINLTNDINKNGQKALNNEVNDQAVGKKSLSQTNKIEPITIGKLEIPSLGSIGIETSLNKKMGLNLWGNFTANDAIKYLNLLPNKSSSRSYQRLLNEVYASTSEPPSGDPDEISEFLKTRLIRLALNGQTEYLIKIISQLPDSQNWERWQKWYVIHHFLIKDDIKACRHVSNNIKNYESIFWKKANL